MLQIRAATKNPERKAYYTLLYPFRLLHAWLTAAQVSVGHGREVAFGYDGGSIRRFQQLPDPDAFRNMVMKENPCRLDIGGIYVSNFIAEPLALLHKKTGTLRS